MEATTTKLQHADDAAATRELLEGNPGLVWWRARSLRFSTGVHARDNGTEWEVFLAGNGHEVLTYSRDEFAAEFELVDPSAKSTEIDRAIFRKVMREAAGR